EAAAAADTFQAEGIDTVIAPQSWQAANGYFGEAHKIGFKPKFFPLDGQANTCTPFRATPAKPLAAGATCLTAWDGRVEPTHDAIKPDNALEAKCRKEYEQAIGRKTVPGGASGSITANGVTYEGDFAPPECMMMNVLLPAIKKAGKTLTWDKTWNNL